MADDEIELFVGLIESIDTPGAVEACRRLLSVDERIRADRFMFERHQRQYIFAHAMLRMALSRAAPEVEPTDWCHFRPAATGGPLSQRLRLRRHCISACPMPTAAWLASCRRTRPSASTSRRCRGASRHLSTALRFFAPEEVETLLRGLPEPAAIERFFDYWTLKEASSESQGLWLNLPLDAFAMQVSREAIEISFKPDISDDPGGGASRCARPRLRIAWRSPTAPVRPASSYHPQRLAAQEAADEVRPRGCASFPRSRATRNMSAS